MKEKDVLFFGTELLVTLYGLYIDAVHTQGDMSKFVLVILLFGCVITARFLLTRFRVGNSWLTAVDSFCLLACFAYGLGGLFPLAAVVIIRLTERLYGLRVMIVLASVGVTLLWLLFPADEVYLLMILLTVPPLCFSLWLVGRLSGSRAATANSQEETEQLRIRVHDDQKRLQTLEYTARLEERNRLTMRIHDKIGHGVSASILLLEAALLRLPGEPGDSARQTIEQAVKGLRDSVDDIRLSLREERAVPGEADLSGISGELARFSQQHGIHTQLTHTGQLELVSPAQWRCIHENLNEAMTNLLKHAKATHLYVSIQVENRLAHVIFRDNGRAGAFKKGMGLLGMEERTAQQNGRCFFQADGPGFHITQVFRLEQ